MNIGFVGLGNMGTGMSTNLAKAGYNVICFDSNEDVFDNLHIDNINQAKNLKEVAVNSNIIFTMLPNGSIVKKVWIDIIEYVNKNTILVDCSTIDVKTSKEVQNNANDTGILSLDAPVSGGVVGSKNGTLTFMVGGSEIAYNKIIPFFEIMGNKSVFCGEIGAGQAAKICNNMLLAITMLGVGEAFNLGKNLGLDLNKLFDVMSTSSASCWAVNTYCPLPGIGPKSPADNDYQPGFSANLMLKDLKLAMEALKETKSIANFGTKSHEAFQQMIENDKGKYDFSAIVNEHNDF